MQREAHAAMEDVGPEETLQPHPEQERHDARHHAHRVGEEDDHCGGANASLRRQRDLQRRGGDHQPGDQRHLQTEIRQPGIGELSRDREPGRVQRHGADSAQCDERERRLRQPNAGASVLAGNEVVETLRQSELEHEVGGGHHQPDLLVRTELRLREQPGEDQRKREPEDRRSAAAEHQGPGLSEDSAGPGHDHPCAEIPRPAPGLSAVPKFVGRAPITGFCSASMTKVSSNWQATSGFE